MVVPTAIITNTMPRPIKSSGKESEAAGATAGAGAGSGEAVGKGVTVGINVSVLVGDGVSVSVGVGVKLAADVGVGGSWVAAKTDEAAFASDNVSSAGDGGTAPPVELLLLGAAYC